MCFFSPSFPPFFGSYFWGGEGCGDVQCLGWGHGRAGLLGETLGNGLHLWSSDEKGDVEHVVAECLYTEQISVKFIGGPVGFGKVPSKQ